MISKEEYESCARRGLQVVSEEGGYYFLKYEIGETYPVRDTTVAEWVEEDKRNQFKEWKTRSRQETPA